MSPSFTQFLAIGARKDSRKLNFLVTPFVAIPPSLDLQQWEIVHDIDISACAVTDVVQRLAFDAGKRFALVYRFLSHGTEFKLAQSFQSISPVIAPVIEVNICVSASPIHTVVRFFCCQLDRARLHQVYCAIQYNYYESPLLVLSIYLHQNYHFPSFEGRLGRGGRNGSLMFGIELFKEPKSGFGLGSKFGVIPPFASGIQGGIVGILEYLSPRGAGGLCKSKDGILLALFGLFSANNLSAKLPCFSPAFVSFLTAYSTLICLPEKNWPFICEIAKSDELKLSQLTNPWPLLVPSSGSLLILVLMIIPKLAKVSYSIFSSTSGSKLPMKRLAPTSCALLSWEALLTLMGLPQSLIICIILIEQSASYQLLNQTNPNPWCSFEILSLGMWTFTTGPHWVNNSQRMFQFTFESKLPAYTVAY